MAGEVWVLEGASTQYLGGIRLPCNNHQIVALNHADFQYVM
jgi:hypothetical protein